MKIMNKRTLLTNLFLLSFIFIIVGAGEPYDNINMAIRSGNAKEISKFFSTSVNLKIFDKEDVYSKTQAELILKDFFTKNTVKSYAMLHQGNSKNGAQYLIGKLETSTGVYRTYVYIKKEAGNNFFIQELRIEVDE
jgi:hypothetical protein